MVVTKTEFLNNYCRICGKTDNICLDLMCEEKYFDKVKELLPLQIEPTDCLPKNLCHICLAKIEEFDALRKNCTEVQQTLIAIARSIIEEETHLPDDESDIEILEVINSSNYKPLTRREENDVFFFESKPSNVPVNGSHNSGSDVETITIDTNESSEEDCSQETSELEGDSASEPRRYSASELERDSASEPRSDTVSEPRRDSAAEPRRDTASELERDSASEPRRDTASELERDSASEPRRDTAAEPRRDSASEPRRNTAAEPRRDSASDPIRLDGWTVQRIPGKDTTLYICNNCSLMLLYESAIRSHNCRESVLVTPLLDENNLKIENRSEIDQDVRKKRKRIYFADDD